MERTEAVVILDNGHGIETEGKRSPDETVLEYLYTRELVAAIATALRADGVQVELLTPEISDTKLTIRTNRANAICYAHGVRQCLLVSVHLNAAGSGASWLGARGWQVNVCLTASGDSKRLAACLFDEASLHFNVRRPDPERKYWPQNLAICRDVACPAVLTESLFMDNKQDLEMLKSYEWFNSLVGIHVNGILKYIDSL